MLIREIVVTTLRNRCHEYWYPEGTLEALVIAGESVQHLGTEVIIDTLEKELRAREFRRSASSFDDPCDAWVA